MTAKEKSIDLIKKIILADNLDKGTPIEKQCALICVDEMIRAIKQIQFNYDIFLEDTEISYLWEVRQEIEKL